MFTKFISNSLVSKLRFKSPSFCFWIGILFLPLYFSSCENKRPDISHITTNINIIRFDSLMELVSNSNIDQTLYSFKEKHPLFYNRYFDYVIFKTHIAGDTFPKYLSMFQNNGVVKLSRSSVDSVYSTEKFNTIRASLNQAFKYIQYHFDTIPLPTIYTYYAGFNTSLMLDSGYIGVGLDKYIGSDYYLYSGLGFAKYLTENMTQERLPIDVIRAFCYSSFPQPYQSKDLLSEIISQGKIYYLTQYLLPEIQANVHFGFTQDQLLVCQENEALLWEHLVSNSLLYNSNLNVINKYTGESPFTNDISYEAPGRAVTWTGYKIVERYMKRNSDVTLSELMFNTNYVQILSKSGYNPK